MLRLTVARSGAFDRNTWPSSADDNVEDNKDPDTYGHMFPTGVHSCDYIYELFVQTSRSYSVLNHFTVVKAFHLTV